MEIFRQSFITYLTGFTPSKVHRFILNRREDKNVVSKDSRKKYSFGEFREILWDIYTKKFISKNKIQVFYNFKGGTGKTSLCHQISVLVSLYGFKVLAIDCDPQGHLSHSLGFDEYSGYETLYDILENNAKFEDVIKNVYPGYDAIPSNLSMTKAEPALNFKPGREHVLTHLLEPLKEKYDFIFLDTNPTISTLNRNALLAADTVNIVCETQPYSLKGLELLISEIQLLENAMHKKIDYKIIANKYEGKTTIAQEVLGSLRDHFRTLVMTSIVNKSEDFNLSAKKRLPVFFFSSKRSAAVNDVVELANELMQNACVQLETKNKVKVDAA